MPAQSILEVTLFVTDVTASAKFYRAIGLELHHGQATPECLAFADGGLGRTSVQLWPAGARDVTRIQLGFRVDCIDDAASRLDDLGVQYERPEPRPHRLRTLDPDGNRVHITDVD